MITSTCEIDVASTINLYSMILGMFPEDRHTLAVPYLRKSHDGIMAFIDWSNISLGYQRHTGRPANELSLEQLKLVLLRGRAFRRLELAGSKFNANFSAKASDLGFTVFHGFRHYDNKERGVDEMLSLSIIKIIEQSKKERKHKGTIVLATGDGQPAALNPEWGFLSAITRAINDGWKIEIYAYENDMSGNWLRLESDFPEQVQIFYLDSFFV